MTRAECSECGETHALQDWIGNDDACPSCGTPHEVPRLQAALQAFERGEVGGKSFGEVLDDYGLGPVDGTNLLLALGVSAETGLDVERRLQGWPGSRWRRLVGETREEERRHATEVRDVLGEYGVSIGVFEDEDA